MKHNSLFSAIPNPLPDELFETLLETPNFKLERIVSDGHATPPGQWLQQERAEWVVLLEGAAALRFEAEEALFEMKAGDYLLIPQRRRHRVEYTDPDKKTVWLAIHFDHKPE